MVDTFTAARLTKLLADWKQRHGRDISMAELLAQGFSEKTIDDLTRGGIIQKYQVTAKGGRTENRFKLLKDWRSLSLN